MDDLERIKALREYLAKLDEAAEEPAATPDDTADEAVPAEPDSEDQDRDDQEIEDLMTEPKKQESHKITVATLASDLGIEDADAFRVAFKRLRADESNLEDGDLMQLGDAFIKMLSADASTAQRAINRLRSIYRKQVATTA